MKSLPRILGVAVLSFAGIAHAALPGAPQNGWAAYNVPLVTGRAAPCCFDHGSRQGSNTCDLDRDQGFSFSDKDPVAQPGDELTVYLRFADGKIDRLRALGANCAVKSATPVQTLPAVDATQSLALLRPLVAQAGGDLDEAALGAIAFHADAAATSALIDFSGAGHARELRKNALFWLGELRGLDGANAVEQVLRTDPDSELRRDAVFALSRSTAIDAHAKLVDIARTDRDAEVRSQALFWIAQGGDKRAKNDILAAIARDASEEVREQGVFALSQLDPGGDEALIELVRGDAPRELKKKALFWLGQSDSDRAVKLLDDVLAGAER